jgi:hypothetical protein
LAKYRSIWSGSEKSTWKTALRSEDCYWTGFWKGVWGRTFLQKGFPQVHYQIRRFNIAWGERTKMKRDKRKKRRKSKRMNKLEFKERQEYYKELVAYIVNRDYGVELDLTKVTEVSLPHIRTDMLFKIPKKDLPKAKGSHLPCLAEVNLLHIKAVNDRLTQEDVVQYLGELYVVGMKEKAKGKNTSLTILSAERILPSVTEGLFYEIKVTEKSWIYQIRAQLPAYIYVLEGLPESEEYWYFWPFQPLSILQEVKQEVKKVVAEAPGNREKSLFVFWLKKLQPEFYEKEIGMPRDVEEVAITVFPKTLQARENKGKEEAKKTIAKNMLRKGLDIAIIAEVTGLELDEIAKLKQE